MEPQTLPELPLLGADAARYVDQLESDLRVHPSATLILEETCKEQSLGLVGPFQSRSFFDALYGPGNWRPLKRHTVHQGDKERPIDDGRAGRHNECTLLSETIVNQRPDFPTAVVKYWGHQLFARLLSQSANAKHSDLATHFPWFRILVGTEDFWKGYRQNHVAREHQGLNIITFVHPGSRKRVYAQMYGMPFGLASAVNQFNRVPQLLTAVCRRILLLVGGHYFDDSIQLEYEALAAKTKLLYIRFLGLFGVEISHHKRQAMTCHPKFLGQITDLTDVLSNLTIRMRGAPESIDKALHLIEIALHTACMTPAEASKLRGVLGWLEGTFAGKPLAGAMSALIARQYWDQQRPLTPPLRQSLEILRLALQHVPPRTVHIFHRNRPLLVYTDASTAAPCKSGCRLGVWINDGNIVLCDSIDVPCQVMHTWLPRKTQINLLELLAVPIVAHAKPAIFEHRDVIWFLDNQAALGSLIRAASKPSDVNYLSLLTGLVFAVLNARPWYEWVPSASNVSDPLSRLGFFDPGVQTAISSGQWQHLNLSPDWSLMQPNMKAIADLITALGKKNFSWQRWGWCVWGGYFPEF